MRRAEDAALLRAKYLDWCSAQVADRFLRLTPDEIFELAEHAADGAEAEPVGSAAVGEATSVGGAVATAPSVPGFSSSGVPYRLLVQRVTETLTAELSLPSFEEWSEAYRASPSTYEADLLGLWRGRSM